MIRWITSFILLLLVGLVAVRWSQQALSPPVDLLLSTSQLQELSELATLRVPITEVVIQERAGPLRLGSTRAMLAVQGHALLSTTIQADCFTKVDAAQRSMVLRLPLPQVTEAVIDHDQSQAYSLDRTGLWSLAFWDDSDRTLINTAYREAQWRIRTTGQQQHFIQQAQHHAEQVLAAWFSRLGWSVAVCWQER